MAGPVPAIHALLRLTKNVDARDKPGHDGLIDVRVGGQLRDVKR
ncbi:hypothetical protein ABIF96_005324 [Bradyrhizobium ottawaense]|uniref:Uncharacterized protein n=1 Tax=Bradyrhizobium ottawaense TaxID=931866 RepID=A0ABV4G0D8_9BRAD